MGKADVTTVSAEKPVGVGHRHLRSDFKKFQIGGKNMAYNKAREEYRWKLWKKHEEDILRKLGMDEDAIQKLRESDWEDFNADRRFQEHQTPVDYMESLLEERKEQEPEIQKVDDLLNSIGDERLLHILLETDKKTLQIIIMKMVGYTPKEISRYMNIPEQTVYTKLRRLREKIKKI